MSPPEREDAQFHLCQNGRVQRVRAAVKRLLGRLPVQGRRVRARYWEHRAQDLIETYDAPETWPSRRWLRSGAEEERVPALLKDFHARTVVVIGCGSGRQFAFLAPHGFALSGFDVSLTMIETCRERFPDVPTHVGDVVGAEKRLPAVDAVVSSAVLAHVPPWDIDAATASLKAMTKRVMILREKTRLDERSDYQWAHNYDRLLRDWICVFRETTDVSDTHTAELMAWVPTR